MEKRTKTYKNRSWLFGIISIILAIGSFRIFARFIHCNANKSWLEWVLLYFFGIAIIGIWGLIRGIKDFKYSGNKIGITGILLNILGIALSILLGFGAGLTIFACTT
ncbi:hypothetical protein KKA09_00715 [Patescibacteria group bacterium]|nr:hypothetical protein [Patescibacteria group bacterium]